MMNAKTYIPAVLPILIGLWTACSAATNGTGPQSSGTENAGGSGGDSVGPGSGGMSAGSSGSGGGDIFGDGGLTGGGGSNPGDGCSDEAKLVYIIGQDNRFYSFYPPTLDVKLVGTINCPGAGFFRPFSMAVDRQGVAWILFEDGRIFHIDVKTAACVQTTYAPNQSQYSTFGMGFVSNSVGSNDETLYVADYLGKGLAKINTTTLSLSTIGPWDKLTGTAELTGTGDSRLYGFFNDLPIIIAEIDKSNGKILSQAPQPTINIGSGWAFAFWGGDFYLFTSPTGQSQIDRYRPADGTTTTVKTGLGTNIVGAGVSTCAPFEPPK